MRQVRGVADVPMDEAMPGDAVRLSPLARLRALLAEYPRAVWMMALCNFIMWTGRGMVIPFTVIYFSQIVGLSASLVGTGIAVSGFAGITFVIFVAGQIDRRGGHPVLLTCLGVISLAMFLYPWATNVALFLIVTLILNCASQLYWPSTDATVAAISHRDRVAEAMSVLRVANAVGIGMGGLLGGAIVAGGGMSEYRILFIVSSLAIFGASLLVWRTVPSVVLPSTNAAGKHGSWSDVLPDRLFLYTQGVLFILIFGFTQMTMTVPAFLRQEAGIGEGTIGLLFAMNTILVVLTQIPIAARVNRGNVARYLALGALFWAIAFGVMLGTPSFGVPAAVLTFLAFTFGELLFMPVTAVIAVRLAPLHLRGRYFAFGSMMWGASYAVASFFGGVALDLPEPAILWPVMFGIMLLGGLGALRMQSAAGLVAASGNAPEDGNDPGAETDAHTIPTPA